MLMDDLDEWDENGITPLMDAVRAGDQQRIVDLVERGAMVDRLGARRRTALMLAAYEGATETVRYLLDKGAQVNLQSNADWTALHFALWKGHSDTVRLLLERGAYAEARTANGSTGLHLAAFSRCTECARLLLDWGVRANLGRYQGKVTPIEEAAKWGEAEIVQLLLEHGADLHLSEAKEAAVWGCKEFCVAKRNRWGFRDVDETLEQCKQRYDRVIELLERAGV